MKLTQVAAVALSLSAGLAFASNQCDGMKIAIENNLPFKLLVAKPAVIGGEIQPADIRAIAENSVMIFTVKTDERKVNFEYTLRTDSIPSKTITLRFDLRNAVGRCDHDDNDSSAAGYSLTNKHFASTVTYTIG